MSEHTRHYIKNLKGTVLGDPRLPPSPAAVDSAITLPIDTLRTLSILKNTSVPLDSVFNAQRGYGYKGIFAAYGVEVLKNITKPFIGPLSIKLSETSVALAGAVVGVFQAIVSNPLEVVKTKIQSQSYKFSTDFEAITYIIKHEGVRVLYCGLEANMWRMALWNSIYFVAIRPARDLARRVLRVNKGYEPGNNSIIMCNILAGITVGLIGNLIIHPFDVAKVILQANSETHKWVLPFVLKLFRDRGLGVFSGFGATALRVLITTPLITLSFEALQRVLAEDDRKHVPH